MVDAKVTVYGAYWCPDCRRAKRFLGEQFVPYNWVDIEQDKDGDQMDEIHPAAAFIFIGQMPNTTFVKGYVEMDKYGFILSGHDLIRVNDMHDHMPLPFEFSVSGIFVAGDARHGSTRQVASAVGEGAAASISIREFLRKS